MDKSIPKKLYSKVNFNIIGDNQQTLHIIIMPCQEVLVNETYVISKNEALINKDTKNIQAFFNSEFEPAYILVSKKEGPILPLDLDDLESMHFNSAYILAYTPNAMIDKCEKVFYKQKLMKAVTIRNEKPGTDSKKGYVFLQLKKFNTLIEETLEEGKELIIKANNIVAISNSLLENAKNDMNFSLPNAIRIKGPGKVILTSKSIHEQATLYGQPKVLTKRYPSFLRINRHHTLLMFGIIVFVLSIYIANEDLLIDFLF